MTLCFSEASVSAPSTDSYKGGVDEREAGEEEGWLEGAERKEILLCDASSGTSDGGLARMAMGSVSRGTCSCEV